MVAPEIAGTVTEIDFDSGATVAKGDLLVRLDSSSEEAQLRADEAQAQLAKLNLDRARKLRETSTISQSDLDTADAAVKQMEANADDVRAIIAKKTIRAPFAGKLGIRQIDLGQSLDVGKSIVSLQALSPAVANFSLPQQDVARLRVGLPAQVTTDTYPGEIFDGTLVAINPDLDQATRNVALQVLITNQDERLAAGDVRACGPGLPGIAAGPGHPGHGGPERALWRLGVCHRAVHQQRGRAGGAVKQFIRLGRTRGDFVSVTAGLKPGQRVVSSGVFKLHNGDHVLENTELAPKPSENPKPADS